MPTRGTRFARRSVKSSKRRKSVALVATPSKKVDKVGQALQLVDKRVSRLSSFVKKGLDKRYVQNFVAATDFSVTGYGYLLNACSQGDAYNNRQGDSTILKSLHLRYTLLSSDTTQYMRVMIVLDKDARGATFTMSDFMDSTFVTDYTYGFRNLDYVDRFVVLADKTYSATTGTSNQRLFGSFNLKMNRKVNYGLGNAGTIADISNGALYLVAFSDSAAVTHPRIQFSYRVNFTG